MTKRVLSIGATGRQKTSVRGREFETAETPSYTGRLARQIARYAPHDGVFDLPVRGLHVSRFSSVSKECVHAVHVPALCIIAQGAKTVTAGKEVYEYDTSRMLTVAVAVPIVGQVVKADASEPYLAARLDFDPSKITDIVLKVFPRGVPIVQKKRAIHAAPHDPAIVNAMIRLIECVAQPADLELLAPLIIDEILIRLFRSDIGPWIAQMGFAESNLQRIAKAIAWLRVNFAQPMKVQSLAELANMSVSSFHNHFRAATSMSPLQYQKVLRLQEARRLMLSTMADVSAASRQVGYLSPSQFSREYSRLFGCAPAKYIARIRRNES